MALQSSGAISLLDIANEFGGVVPHSLSEYYGVAAGVPSSGAISFSNFYGTSSATITLNNSYVVDDSVPSPGTSTATFTLESDGDISQFKTSTGTADIGDWISPKTAAPGSYEVRATLFSGAPISGTTNTWLALSTTRSWSLSVTSGQSLSVIDIEIRLGTTVLDTTRVTLSAEVLGGGFN